VVVDSGLYELFTRELFPEKPNFVISPLEPLIPLIDRYDLLTRWPETKANSTSRTLESLQFHTSQIGSSPETTAIVFVAHQFTCKTLAVHLLRTTEHGHRLTHNDWKRTASQMLQEAAHHDFGPSLQVQLPDCLSFEVGSVTVFMQNSSMSFATDENEASETPLSLRLISYIDHLNGAQSSSDE
jgi:hypothetical protein